MDFDFQIITQEQAEGIAYNWKYDGEYAFYDLTADEEDLAEFLDGDQRGNSTYAVLDQGEMIGFYTFNELNESTIDIGLGMHPNLTGKGKGEAFTRAGVDFSIARYAPETLTLSVAAFNNRAIKVYKKVGFVPIGAFIQETNGSRYEFIKMSYPLSKQRIGRA
ncbi:GNAT family N-acetyltransferase [Rossellomorea aquimaris]|uniref:GNAT family N-acetyltransferase n=1 Tax=Rossellomorea aquimaris TaxID=189382 RepID=A0A5D4TSZ6_9BACI|nr:GNAT family protein [Rossellomorea aquimaris]TYS79010.1 GNAT family N-acetyltransferase [Rossellomorea aquimaris]TYS84755.1 GNAT family N-acetyltransferase [Rossellomorea aquimaris]